MGLSIIHVSASLAECGSFSLDCPMQLLAAAISASNIAHYAGSTLVFTRIIDSMNAVETETAHAQSAVYTEMSVCVFLTLGRLTTHGRLPAISTRHPLCTSDRVGDV